MQSGRTLNLRNLSRVTLVLVLAGLAAWLALRGTSRVNEVTGMGGQPESGDAGLRDAASERIEQLDALGYLDGSEPATDQQGVTVYDHAAAWDGLNLFTSGHGPEAILMDMQGDILHSWRCPFRDVWPDRALTPEQHGYKYWRRVHLYENGDLLAIFEDLGLVKLDKDSNLLWAYSGQAHHDFEVQDNGDIYVLTRVIHPIPELLPQWRVLEDFVTVLDAGGKPKRQVSLLDCVRASEFGALLADWLPDEAHPFRDFYARVGVDLFHTNTLGRLDGSLAHVSPHFKAGNVLTAFREVDALAIVDVDAEKAVWLKTGLWDGPHQPTLLDNGNILVFDNNRSADYSRVLEFEPATGNTVWSYMGTPPSSFYTKGCGSCQPLPNGNVLITESEAGRAFEVTREGAVVWEFVNPHRVGKSSEKVAYIYEMLRLRPDFPLAWAGARVHPQDATP